MAKIPQKVLRLGESARPPDDGVPEHLGWVTIDKAGAAKPDILWDLEGGLPIFLDKNRLSELGITEKGMAALPLEEGTFDRVVAEHVLEHIGEGYIGLLRAVWDVLKPGGIFEVLVPHYLSKHAWGDPTHVRAFSETSFDYLTEERKQVYRDRYEIPGPWVKGSLKIDRARDIQAIMRKPEVT